MSNTAKYLSYQEAWRRIKAANEAGFHFETVTLCESIISDRLLSYIRGINPSSKTGTRTHFAKLILEWRKCSAALPLYKGTDLGSAVDAWRDERNLVVHGLTKSEPGTATDELQPFLARAETTAAKGVELARAVSTWHKKQLTSHRANN